MGFVVSLLFTRVIRPILSHGVLTDVVLFALFFGDSSE